MQAFFIVVTLNQVGVVIYYKPTANPTVVGITIYNVNCNIQWDTDVNTNSVQSRCLDSW